MSSRRVPWYKLCPGAMVLLVVVRGPEGKRPDDFFFTTDLSMAPGEVLSLYGDRWAVECTYRDVEQLAHGQEPQTWKGKGPERTANLAFCLPGALWLWYLGTSATSAAFVTRPWYSPKRPRPSPTPSPSPAKASGKNAFLALPEAANKDVKLQRC